MGKTQYLYNKPTKSKFIRYAEICGRLDWYNNSEEESNASAEESDSSNKFNDDNLLVNFDN